ncbi:hypothetical protein SS50377_20589 [Spironucleus salmonicida]|uniref:C3H1-type domain-containing protein n=1 Tax=Spironucleus salmonicida TaxID=348837 RepID=V6LWS1_9EUKA|nr:hypothetical protein SS50377_28774 [Spironucleus salmonicida]KAH0577238.1 hypothetical protein SS50377_20589 [Spironucleus salmonicida]|eukprot:EST48156.1 hypothetical protein SS50377_11674 [Spironucleus salmonicida]
MSSFSSDFEDAAYSLPFDAAILQIPPIPHPLHSVSAPFQLLGNTTSYTSQTSHSNSLQKICKNYIRGGCNVADCKFFHPSPIELIVHAQEIANIYTQKYGKIEICKDYLNGKCDRFQCKYKHCDDYWKEQIDRFNSIGEHVLTSQSGKFKISSQPSQGDQK